MLIEKLVLWGIIVMDFFSKIKEKIEKRRNKTNKSDDFTVLDTIFSNVNTSAPKKSENIKIHNEYIPGNSRIIETERTPVNNLLNEFRKDKPLKDYSEFINYISEKSKSSINQNISEVKWSSKLSKNSNKITAFSNMMEIKPLTSKTTLNKYANIKITTPDSLFVKVCLLGDGAVGKTALRRTYLGEDFRSEYLMTIGADFALTSLNIDNIEIKFQIWDLAGQPRFNLVRNTYYTGSYGALIIYDRTRPESFNSCLNWLSELWKGSGRGPIPFVLLGNKSDLIIDNESQVTDTQALKLINTFNQETIPRKCFEVNYFQTSAKTHQNVDKAFYFLGSQVLSWIKTIKAKKALKQQK